MPDIDQKVAKRTLTQLRKRRRGVTEIEKSNARRLKQQLPDMVEDPAAAQWREKAFNFYDKR